MLPSFLVPNVVEIQIALCQRIRGSKDKDVPVLEIVNDLSALNIRAFQETVYSALVLHYLLDNHHVCFQLPVHNVKLFN